MDDEFGFPVHAEKESAVEAAIEAKRQRFLRQINPLDNPLEKNIEKAWNKIAKKHGWLIRKMQNQIENSDPDRFYARAGSRPFLIEYKRKGKKQTEAQAQKAREWEAAGLRVFVVDAIDKEYAELTFL